MHLKEYKIKSENPWDIEYGGYITMVITFLLIFTICSLKQGGVITWKLPNFFSWI